MLRRPASQIQHNNSGQTGSAFAGFALPTSNTTYTPNQFFDVCLPHYPRGVGRLVGYMIRKTLGWCDAQGRPQAERFAVTYSELQQKAGISRDMIRGALKEAVEGQFIRCTRQAAPKSDGQAAVSGIYELRWDERGEYVKDPKRFRGFFAGEGNRTYIPNQFFDDLLPNESLAVMKVVGSVVRLSIGFQNKWGHRRRNVALSYQHIQNYSRLKDRKTLSQAIKHALNHNYIERVEDGFFDPDGGRLSKAAVYALKWLSQASSADIGRKSPPAEIDRQNRSEKPTGIGQKNQPDGRSENPTGIEIKQRNKTYKQQDEPAVAASFEALKRAGFDAKTAHAIASKYPVERILRQIEWIDLRKVKTNRLGMLRLAIENDWPKPTGSRQLGRPNSEARTGTAASIADIIAAGREQFRQQPNRHTS